MSAASLAGPRDMASTPEKGKVRAFPATPPMPVVARILSRFQRLQIEAFLAVALDLLDTLDGDRDLEDDDSVEDSDPAENDDPAEDDDAGESEGHDKMSNQPLVLN